MTGIIFEHSGGKEHQRAPNKDNKAVNHQNRLPHQENPLLLQIHIIIQALAVFFNRNKILSTYKPEEKQHRRIKKAPRRELKFKPRLYSK